MQFPSLNPCKKSSYQVSGEDEGVADDPGHGGEGLGLPAAEEGVAVGAVPELVGEVPVEVLPVRVGPPHAAARHAAAVALPERGAFSFRSQALETF